MRQFISIIILAATLFGTSYDSWGSSEIASRQSTVITDTCSVTQAPESTQLNDHVEHSSMASSDQGENFHDCHLGHCSFVVAAGFNPVSFTNRAAPIAFRNTLSIKDVVSYISRPPAA